jgi:putative redox protein
MSQITVRHDTNDRFSIDLRGHRIVVDQPPPASSDAGPTPTELFVASLAACAAFYARRFLARHGVADGELVVTADFAWAADHSRVAAVAIRVETPRGIPEALRPALVRVLDHCTVHESIRQELVVNFHLVAEAAPTLA